MKPIKILLPLLLCLALGLSACSGAVSNAVKAEEAAALPAEPAGEPEIGTVLPDSPLTEEFYALDGAEPVYGSAAEKAAEVPGYAGDPTPAEPGAPEEAPAGIYDPAVEIEAPAPSVSEPVSPAGEALTLTAAEWNDNQNWPFFTNLVNSGAITFPSYGIDPRNRLQVTVTDAAGAPLVHESVLLYGAGDQLLWTARTDKAGVAYLFWSKEQSPERVVCGAASQEVLTAQTGEDPQGKAEMVPVEALTLTAEPAATPLTALQVMFIVDTTGSMGDELAYLQKDFAAIAQRVGTQGVSYAVAFYRDQGDEYVTKYEGFTDAVETIRQRINAEYANGGGDMPEAVAEVLTQCLTDCADWREDCAKLAFLIFDAPPHEGREAELQAAVRAAAEQGIRLVPVVASNAQRDTELFGRALAICTNGSYVFLTDDSGVGDSHLEPIVGSYSVELLQDVIVRIIEAAKP